MPLPERVLIDTSAFYALISRADAFHQQAHQTYERLIDWHLELWTTSYVFAETATLVHKRLGYEVLVAFAESLRGIVQTHWVDQTAYEDAWKQLVSAKGLDMGMVDWTTAIAATRLHAHVFTFDKGFARRGIAVLAL